MEVSLKDLDPAGGTVVDGKRSQPYAADICIREDASPASPRRAARRPGGGGRVRTGGGPGFIDIHTSL